MTTQLRYDYAEIDLKEFLLQFADVETCGRKVRWELEKRWYEAFNGSAEGKGVCGSFVGSDVEAFESGAYDAYDRVRSTTFKSQYIAVPSVPTTVAFVCNGTIPSMTDWQKAARSNGLPFSITIADLNLNWTAVLIGEYAGIPCSFAYRRPKDEDDA